MRYLGSKSLLLNEINDLLSKHLTGNEESFVDLFAGTNVVGKHFKERYKIISNDLLFFSYCHAKAVIENNRPLEFVKLDIDPFTFLNDQTQMEQYDGDSYYTKNYTPLGDAMYFTEENGRRIDFIRNTIERWNMENLLTEL
ncbi:Modification methylase FokI [Oligella sp. MSHR50489EDL]|uniref:DNA adenine methylase n=1 Tax=Oligella sp. MSHR50489EDL TaxID=3139409 RepID=UPI003D819800